MIICNCHPFGDTEFNGYRACNEGNRITAAAAYKACSGQNKPNCGKCVPTVVDRVKEHNSGITVQELAADVATVAAPVKQPA